MNPLAALWLFASAAACQLAFPPTEAEPIAACGPYVELETLRWDGVDAVSDLSVDATGARGFVMARRGGDVRLTPIAKQGDAWAIDPARVLNLDTLHDSEGVRVGRVSPDGELYVAQIDLAQNRTRVFHYVLAANPARWALRENTPVSPASATEATFPGGAVEINDGFGDDRFTRHVPIVHEASADLDRFVSIETSLPQAPADWFELLSDGQLATDAINKRHEVTAASIALRPDHTLVMAYAGAAHGASGSSLFLSDKEPRAARYRVGAHLAELDGAGDEVEPFLADGCATLYFRRAGEFIKAEVVPP